MLRGGEWDMTLNVITSEMWHTIGRLAGQLNGTNNPTHAQVESILYGVQHKILHNYVSRSQCHRGTYIIDCNGFYHIGEGIIAYNDDLEDWCYTNLTNYHSHRLMNEFTIIAEIIPRDEYNSRIAAEKEAI